MDQTAIGKFISQCRKEKHLTQAQLAERLGVSDRAVSKWETGRSMPDVSIMLDLCEQIDISVNDLLNARRITMENYKEIAEKTLLEMREREEQSARKMLSLEWVIAFIAEEPTWAKIVSAAIPILYCGLMSGGLGYTLQIVAQKFTDPTIASLLMSLESVFAVLAPLPEKKKENA